MPGVSLPDIKSKPDLIRYNHRTSQSIDPCVMLQRDLTVAFNSGLRLWRLRLGLTSGVKPYRPTVVHSRPRNRT